MDLLLTWLWQLRVMMCPPPPLDTLSFLTTCCWHLALGAACWHHCCSSCTMACTRSHHARWTPVAELQKLREEVVLQDGGIQAQTCPLRMPTGGQMNVS